MYKIPPHHIFWLVYCIFISWAQLLNSDIIEHCLREIRSEPASYSEVQLYTIISFAHKSISFTFALGQCYTPIQQLQAWPFTWCAAKALVWNSTKACAAQVTWGMSDLSLTFPNEKVTCSILYDELYVEIGNRHDLTCSKYLTHCICERKSF